MITDELRDWLLDADPSLRWQVERDLLHLPEERWQATRARTATEGFGARLLALQDPEGTWAHGAHFPGGWDWAAELPQPWTATDWTLNLLRGWGVPAEALGDTADRIAANCRWEYDDLPFWGGEVDCCINSWTLSNGLWLGVDVDPLVDWFVEHRLPDGGWDCEWVSGSTHSSFHSTLNSLLGLLDAELAGHGTAASRAARKAGEEYLLERRLLYRRSTGELVGAWATRGEAPFRWIYSALRAADYFRAAALHDGTAPDPRMTEAIERIRTTREPEGWWRNQRRDPGEVWFETEADAGEPSRGLTLVGTRVLDWWDGATV